MPYSTPDNRYSEAKFYGNYRALVKDNKDPKKIGRIIVQVPEIFGASLLTDWAFPKNGSFSGPDKGDFVVPDINDGVWVEFEAGDTHRPLWSGRWWAEPGGVSEIPQLAQGNEDESQQSPKGTDSFAIIGGTDIAVEPDITYAAQYPYDKVIKTKAGIVMEMDDTPGAVRFHIWHPSESWLEIHNDGRMVIRNAAERYEIVTGTHNLHVKSGQNILIDGDATFHVKGNYLMQVDGSFKIQAGDPSDPGSNSSLSLLSTGDQTFLANGKQSIRALMDQIVFGLTQKIYAGVADIDPGIPPLIPGVQIIASGWSQQNSVGIPAVVPLLATPYGSKTTVMMGNEILTRIGTNLSSTLGSNATVLGGSNIMTTAGDDLRISAGTMIDMANLIMQNP